MVEKFYKIINTKLKLTRAKENLSKVILQLKDRKIMTTQSQSLANLYVKFLKEQTQNKLANIGLGRKAEQLHLTVVFKIQLKKI
jgi:hypothetical protein